MYGLLVLCMFYKARTTFLDPKICIESVISYKLCSNIFSEVTIVVHVLVSFSFYPNFISTTDWGNGISSYFGKSVIY